MFLQKNKRSEKKVRDGIRLRRFNAILIAIASVFAVLLLVISYEKFNAFLQMTAATEAYVRAQRAVSQMQEGSHYLTDRARTFVATGDRAALEDYCNEVQVTRRRDNALEEMESFLTGTETVRYLDEALRVSNELMHIEYRAMRLTIDALGEPVEDYPAVLREITLSDGEKALPRKEKLDLALSLLFDETYRSYKQSISENVSECENALIGETSREQDESEARFLRLLLWESILIAAELLMVLAVVLAITYLIIHPMEKIVGSITSNTTVPVIGGAHEVRFLTRAYNAVFEQTRRQKEQLSYEASHDQMTGLLNRAVFDRTRAANERRAHALMLIDVDSFKQFNDTYGHSIGDQVLQKVAAALTANFRSEDFVCRIGGDEFAVLMVHADSRMRDIVAKKLHQAAERLRDTSDGLPKVTLSIGIAFSDRRNPTDDIYKDADAALYRVKARGRDGIAFYGED